MANSSSSSSSSSGVGLSGLTFIVFLVLKLTGVIDWSWWWVTAPLWINAIIVILAVAGGVLLMRKTKRYKKW